MRRHAALIWGLFALSVTAHGELRLFWSTTGLANTAFTYSTALRNFLPIVSATPVTELPAGTYDLYLWGEFIQNEDPNDRRFTPLNSAIIGMQLTFAGDAAHGLSAAYRHSKSGPDGYRRWDGSLGIPLDGVMVAVTARGIEFIVSPNDNQDLYFPETRQFLIGAAEIAGAVGQTKAMFAAAGAVVMWPWPTGGGDIPELMVVPAMVTFTPEPTATTAVFLAILARARRPWARRR